jgi:hypothetical protein
VKQLLEKQGWHVFVLTILVVGLFFGVRIEGVLAGELFNAPTSIWLWFSVTIPIVHQVFAVLVWRAQLHNKWMTRIFGDSAFTVYAVLFNVLFLARPATIFCLGVANMGSFALDWVWRILLFLFLFVPFVYLMYSTLHYFGYKRAIGADHFEPEVYRQMPLVKEGIFKFTSNGMYTFGFFILWLPGVIFASKAALLAAAFSHFYIWVHYYTTEKPDMKRIYGDVF